MLQPDVVRRLRSRERAVLGLSVELVQVEAERAEEQKRVFADGFACREGAFGTRQAELIAQRRVDEHVAERAQERAHESRRTSAETVALDADRRAA